MQLCKSLSQPIQELDGRMFRWVRAVSGRNMVCAASVNESGRRTAALAALTPNSSNGSISKSGLAWVPF